MIRKRRKQGGFWNIAIPGLIGLLGLKQNADQNKAANKQAGKAGKLSDVQFAALQKLMGLADQYDPKAQTKVAVDAASGVASQTLERALKGIKGQAGPEGPGDSAFHVTGQRAVNDNLDPLKMFAAQETAMEASRKADMYQRVLGAPTGQIGDNYFRAAASMPRSDPAGSMALLSQALQRMLAGQGGAGGRGDSFNVNNVGTGGTSWGVQPEFG